MKDLPQYNTKPYTLSQASMTTDEKLKQDKKLQCISKVPAMFWTSAYGDALGLPFETMKHGEINQDFFEDPSFRPVNSNPFLENHPPGTWSDDTQLALATAKGLCLGSGFNIESQINTHISALDESTLGWGKSTKLAVQKLKDGISPDESGVPSTKGAGLGNGVCMKLWPLAAFLYVSGKEIGECVDIIAAYTALTHKTSEALASALALSAAFFECFKQDPNNFNSKQFVAAIVEANKLAGDKFEAVSSIDVTSILETLKGVESLNDAEIVERYNQGTCLVYNSLPFSLAFFIRKPNSIEALYDVINAGGDTDSNAAMVGALLAALNGDLLVQNDFIQDLNRWEEIREVVDEFKGFLELSFS